MSTPFTPRRIAGAGLALGALAGAVASLPSTASGAAAAGSQTSFNMVRSTASISAGCLPRASATVRIQSQGPVEVMTVNAKGLPKNTDFDLFVIQVPDQPFGLSWYQGDLETNASGTAQGTFRGRFSVETFTVAPGTAPAPVKHTSPIPDASSNPATAPVHQYHLGLWFNSATDAAAAGCLNTVTPFNGVHNAGVQALSTRQFAVGAGPLSHIH